MNPYESPDDDVTGMVIAALVLTAVLIAISVAHWFGG